MESKETFQFLLGKHEAAAWETIQDLEAIPRIVRRNGIPLVVTRDYNPNRINLEIESNIVVKVHKG